MLKMLVPYYLGIDGGGTKTACALGDDSNLLASVTTGPSNVIRVGESKARESLHEGVRQVCAAAGVTPNQISSTCIGAAGAATQEIKNIIRRALIEILPAPIQVVGDTEITLEAAFGEGSGVIVIAGTGSIAYGRNQQGTTARAGGWGFAVSDEGSAHWIGRSTIAAILRARVEQNNDEQGSEDAGTKIKSSLQQALLKAWGVTSLEDLVRTANSAPAPNFAELFPEILVCAESGDPLAQQVLTNAGRELAQLAAIVIRRLFPECDAAPNSARQSPVHLAMAGGVFRHAPLVGQIFYNEIHNTYPLAECHSKVVDPVDGALRIARRMASPLAAPPR